MIKILFVCLGNICRSACSVCFSLASRRFSSSCGFTKSITAPTTIIGTKSDTKNTHAFVNCKLPAEKKALHLVVQIPLLTSKERERIILVS